MGTKIPLTKFKKPQKAKIITAEHREIGSRINAMREALGLRHQDIAIPMDRTEATVKKIVAGEAVDGFVKLAHLARVLKTTPNDILGVSDSGALAVQPEIWAEVIEEILHETGFGHNYAHEIACTVVRAATGPLMRQAGVDAHAALRIQVRTAIRLAAPQERTK